MRPKVFLTRKIPAEALDLIARVADATVWPGETPPARDELIAAVADADGLLCLLTDRIDGEVIAAGSRLKVISNYAVGVDNIDVATATRRGIVVTNTPGVLTETTADLAFALILATARRIVEADRCTRTGGWRTWSPMFLVGQDVHGATLGLVGMGRISRAVARRARGFDMNLLYFSTRRHPEAEMECGARFVPLDTLLRESDFVSLHVPLSASTTHLIGRRELELMKPTAILVNTSRGAVVDEQALVAALERGALSAAGLDVYETEPLPPESPLLRLDNVVLLPHIGSASVATRTRMALVAATNLVDVLSGRRPANPVNLI